MLEMFLSKFTEIVGNWAYGDLTKISGDPRGIATHTLENSDLKDRIYSDNKPHTRNQRHSLETFPKVMRNMAFSMLLVISHHRKYVEHVI